MVLGIPRVDSGGRSSESHYLIGPMESSRHVETGHAPPAARVQKVAKRLNLVIWRGYFG